MGCSAGVIAVDLARDILEANRNSYAVEALLHPHYKLTFEHSCIHAASKAILDQLQRNLKLSNENMEASRMTLHRLSNTSSSSIRYELAYLEAKCEVRKGDHIWQIAFGSGFKCNSLVWRSMIYVRKPADNPWLDCIDGTLQLS